MILGASFDSPEENKAFKDKFRFPFALLCDTSRELGLKYGACERADAEHANRVSVVIGPDGKVARVYPSVDAAAHPEQVLADLG